MRVILLLSAILLAGLAPRPALGHDPAGDQPAPGSQNPAGGAGQENPLGDRVSHDLKPALADGFSPSQIEDIGHRAQQDPQYRQQLLDEIRRRLASEPNNKPLQQLLNHLVPPSQTPSSDGHPVNVPSQSPGQTPTTSPPDNPRSQQPTEDPRHDFRPFQGVIPQRTQQLRDQTLPPQDTDPFPTQGGQQPTPPTYRAFAKKQPPLQGPPAARGPDPARPAAAPAPEGRTGGLPILPPRVGGDTGTPFFQRPSNPDRPSLTSAPPIQTDGIFVPGPTPTASPPEVPRAVQVSPPQGAAPPETAAPAPSLGARLAAAVSNAASPFASVFRNFRAPPEMDARGSSADKPSGKTRQAAGAASPGDAKRDDKALSWMRIFSADASAPVTRLAAPGLNGDSDVEYRVVARWVNASKSLCGYHVQPNGDADAENYGWTGVWGNGKQASTAKRSSAPGLYLGAAAPGHPLSLYEGVLFAKSGNERLFMASGSERASKTAILVSDRIDSVWGDKSSNITSLAFVADQEGGIGAGSHVEIWALRGASRGGGVGGSGTAGQVAYWTESAALGSTAKLSWDEEKGRLNLADADLRITATRGNRGIIFPDGSRQTSALLPSGAMIAFAGSAPPGGWLDCDGSAVSRSDYPELFRTLGTVWGRGDGRTTFNLPDLRGRNPRFIIKI